MIPLLHTAISERFRGAARDEALYKSTFTLLLYFTTLTALSFTRYREASSVAMSKPRCIRLDDMQCNIHCGIATTRNVLLCSVGTCQQWTQLANTNYANGQWSPADSVLLCQSACYSNYACTGFDWVSGASPGQRCWLSGPWSGAQRTVSVTHYTLNRSCTY